MGKYKILISDNAEQVFRYQSTKSYIEDTAIGTDLGIICIKLTFKTQDQMKLPKYACRKGSYTEECPGTLQH